MNFPVEAKRLRKTFSHNEKRRTENESGGLINVAASVTFSPLLKNGPRLVSDGPALDWHSQLFVYRVRWKYNLRTCNEIRLRVFVCRLVLMLCVLITICSCWYVLSTFVCRIRKYVFGNDENYGNMEGFASTSFLIDFVHKYRLQIFPNTCVRAFPFLRLFTAENIFASFWKHVYLISKRTFSFSFHFDFQQKQNCIRQNACWKKTSNLFWEKSSSIFKSFAHFSKKNIWNSTHRCLQNRCPYILISFK